MKILAIAFFLAIITGCATTPYVTDAKDSDSINSVFMTCNSPYILKQDCSIWSGATRSVTIDGFEVKISGSEDGKTILVMDSKLISNMFADLLLLNSPTHSKASNNSYYAIKKVLDKNKIKINRVRPLRSLGNVDGYILELATNGYSLLKNHY